MNRAIPVINTARLSLRAMRPEDFDRYAEIWAAPGVVRHIGGPPWSRTRAWDSFLRNAGHWQMMGFGQWAVTEQASRRMIGQVGFFYACRGLEGAPDTIPEAGWVLAEEAQGRGYGAEAAQAVHDWFDRVIPGPLVCLVAQTNPRSRSIAERLGYGAVQEVQIEGDRAILMRRDRPPQTAQTPQNRPPMPVT